MDANEIRSLQYKLSEIWVFAYDSLQSATDEKEKEFFKIMRDKIHDIEYYLVKLKRGEL